MTDTQEREKWSQPHEVEGVDLAFPARGLELSPPREFCERELELLDEDVRKKWLNFQSRWFGVGLPLTTQFGLREGIDGRAAFNHLKVVQGSYAAKHEHKVAAVAYLASRWFDDVAYEGFN